MSVKILDKETDSCPVKMDIPVIPNVRMEQYALRAETDSCSVKMDIPVIRLSTGKKGPLLAIMACQHGRELNGIEVIRQLIPRVRNKLERGSCICIPCVNQLAVRMRQQDYPLEYGRYYPDAPCYNLNRIWPGRPDGSLNEAIAHTLWTNVIRDADVLIDLHGWTGMSSSLAWAHERNRELLRAFGLEIFTVKEESGTAASDVINGMLDKTCYENGIASLTVELTPQNKLSEKSVKTGLRGVMNVMKKLKMLPGKLELPARQIEYYSSNKQHAVIAEKAGLLVFHRKVLDILKKGEVFAEIVNLDNVLETWPVAAPADGALFNAGGLIWAEHFVESSIIERGGTLALIQEVSQIIRNK